MLQLLPGHPPTQAVLASAAPTFHPDNSGGRAASRQAAKGQGIALQEHLVLQLDVKNGGEIWRAEGMVRTGCQGTTRVPHIPAMPT